MTRWSDIQYRLHYLRLAAQGLHLPAWFGTWSWGTRLGAVVLALAAYYVGGGLWVNRVDTDPVPKILAVSAGHHSSRAIYAAAQLTLREVDQHHWTPADPFFLPGAVLGTMPRFQQGMIAAIGRFADTLSALDGGADGNLMQAAGLYKYPGTVWRMASGISWLPTAPSSRQYRVAAHALEGYNDSFANGDQLSVVQQPGALAAVLDSFAVDLDGMTDRLTRHLDGDPSVLFDGEGRAMFHSTRGHLYAWGILLGELAKDDAGLIAERGLNGQWRRLVEIALKAAAMDPSVVTTGNGLVANHLAEQGFSVLRARALVGEIKANLVRSGD